MFKTDTTRAPAPAARRSRGLRGAVLLITGLALGACDLEVTSPSHLADEDLEHWNVTLALLRGVEGDFAHATAGLAGNGGLYLHGALLTDELVHSGIRPAARMHSDGLTADDLTEINELWAFSSQARFTAEELVPRLRRVIPMQQDSLDIARAALDADQENRFTSRLATLEGRLLNSLVWAGMANRVMGDHFCNAVIDGGALQDHTEYYRRAEGFFTQAVQRLEDLVVDEEEAGALGVYVGRAHVRMMLGDWAGAEADAAQVTVPGSLSQTHAFYTGREREWNFFFRNSLFAEREVTVWGTPFADWGRNLSVPVSQRKGDPRALWDRPPGSNAIGADERRPFWRQRKHTSSGGNIRIASWQEARLIEAEARLVRGDWQGAIAKINEVREQWNSPTRPAADRLPLIDVSTVSGQQEAWELLMRERGIEFWQEGRRLADLRRWSQTPGFVNTTVVREAGSGGPETDAVRPVLNVQGPLCLPVSADERRSNPNI